MVSRHEIVTLVRTDRKRQAASRNFVNQTSIGYNLCGQASQFHVYVLPFSISVKLREGSLIQLVSR